MPTVQEVVKDPEFLALPDIEKKKVMQSIDTNFAGLPDIEQNKVLTAFSTQPTETGGLSWDKVKGDVQSGLQNIVPAMGKVVQDTRRPVLEGAGMVLGEMAGAVGGQAGTVAGGATGYAVGKRIADVMDGKRFPFAKSFIEMGSDIKTGAEMEMAGGVIGKAVGTGLKYAGKLGKEVLGRTTGTGVGTVEEALKGGTEFKKAMRGETTGQDVVDTARDALQTIKNQRALNYQKDLIEISKVQSNLDATQIADTLGNLMQKYNVKITPKGKLDDSLMAMGKAGRKDTIEAIKEVMKWSDNSPTGLDTLKRRLDDFYSDSSQARGFVATLRKSVNDTISKAVPKYGEMTKGYADATNLIKDIESALMLRKQGMSGRVTADNTLRRLTSSMKENFEMRRDLVNILGEKASEDLAGQIAGYNANQLLPRGLMAHLSGGSLWAVAHFLNPKFYPLLAASSPRIVGEFLTVYGKAVGEISKVAPATYKTLGYGAGKLTTHEFDPQTGEIKPVQ